jgi:hypothetical protein
MTSWEIYIVTVDPGPVALEIERLHSTWETQDDALHEARKMVGYNVRVRERFEDK